MPTSTEIRRAGAELLACSYSKLFLQISNSFSDSLPSIKFQRAFQRETTIMNLNFLWICFIYLSVENLIQNIYCLLGSGKLLGLDKPFNVTYPKLNFTQNSKMYSLKRKAAFSIVLLKMWLKAYLQWKKSKPFTGWCNKLK